jgi:uncharacterized protein (TIGR02246 family)
MIGRALALCLALAAQGGGARDAVVAVMRGIIAADNARDLSRVLSFYADDAMLIPPGEPLISGLAAIRPRYEALFRAFDPAIEGQIDEVVVQGSLAFVRGRNGGVLRGREGGADRPLHDVYLAVLRRTGGGWRISRLIWHPAPASAGGGEA